LQAARDARALTRPHHERRIHKQQVRLDHPQRYAKNECQRQPQHKNPNLSQRSLLSQFTNSQRKLQQLQLRRQAQLKLQLRRQRLCPRQLKLSLLRQLLRPRKLKL